MLQYFTTLYAQKRLLQENLLDIYVCVKCQIQILKISIVSHSFLIWISFYFHFFTSLFFIYLSLLLL